MRAGSLSDPRVVALLRLHFVCVHMPELVTRDLIADPRDAELLERYDRELRERRPAYGNPGLHGGEREVFLAPDGELLDIFLSLHEGEGQCRRVASDAVDLAPAEVRDLLPERLEPGARAAVPRPLLLRLARAAYPRGAGVLLDLPDTGIEARLETTVRTREGTRIEARLRGRIALRAEHEKARGRRATYRPFRSAEVALAGELLFDAASGRLVRLRLAGAHGVGRYRLADEVRECSWEVAMVTQDQPDRSATSSRKRRRHVR